MVTQTIAAPRLERLAAVCARIGVGRSTIYRWIGAGRFPAPVRIGPHTAAWDARLIDRWIEARIADSQSASTVRV